MKEQATPLARAVGERIRQLRDEHGLLQEQVAEAAAKFGLEWSAATIAALETGRRRLDADELVLLPFVFGYGLQLPEFQLADLFPGTRWIAVGGTPLSSSGEAVPRAFMREDLLRRVVSGQVSDDDAETDRLDVPITRAWQAYLQAAGKMFEVRTVLWPDAPSVEQLKKLDLSVGEAERKAARKLDVPAFVVILAAYGRWGKGLTAERNERAAKIADEETTKESIQRIRGRVTRALIEELGPPIDRVRPILRRHGSVRRIEGKATARARSRGAAAKRKSGKPYDVGRKGKGKR